jgi:UDPglucose 6-dehydrogenase
VLRIARVAPKPPILVIITPVPVGTGALLERKLAQNGSKATIVSHPVFLTAGCAVEDLNWPDRIILGTSSSDAVHAMKQVFHPLVMRGVPVIVTNHETAELVREAATAYLMTKISFINEVASLCEKVNADAVHLALALGLDKKIAPRCLQPGAGMGGIFAESDMDLLTELAQFNGVPLKILSAAREVNAKLADRLAERVSGVLDHVEGKQIAILFSVELAKTLVAQGAKVRAYDPAAIPNAKLELNGSVQYADTAYAAVEGCDVLVVGTGWPEFRSLDFDRIKRSLKRPLIIDTKNLLDAARLRTMGFEYLSVGRSDVPLKKAAAAAG